MVTEGALTGAYHAERTAGVDRARRRLDELLTDDYAPRRAARSAVRGSEWYVEDLGSTNSTYLDRAKVTAVRVPIGTPVRIGKAQSSCARDPRWRR